MHSQNTQNQGAQANQQFPQVQNQNKANFNFETGSELTQSSGQISRILATQKLVGLEIGGLGQSNQSQNQTPNQYQRQNYQTPNNYLSNAQLEVDQAAGPLSQNLSQQSQQ